MSEEAQESQSQTPVAAEAGKGRDGETPEQTIAALREALQKTRDEAKANRVKAEELDGIKQAQMSDLEKAQQAAKAFEDEAKAAKAEALRFKIATKHGISEDDAESFLTGLDEATLTKQAERLAALTRGASPTTPKPDLSQGKSGNSAPPTAAEQFAAAFDGRL